jgi:hypothetical protein
MCICTIFFLNFRVMKFRDSDKSIFIQPTIWCQNQNLELLEALTQNTKISRSLHRPQVPGIS